MNFFLALSFRKIHSINLQDVIRRFRQTLHPARHRPRESGRLDDGASPALETTLESSPSPAKMANRLQRRWRPQPHWYIQFSFRKPTKYTRIRIASPISTPTWNKNGSRCSYEALYRLATWKTDPNRMSNSHTIRVFFCSVMLLKIDIGFH